MKDYDPEKWKKKVNQDTTQTTVNLIKEMGENYAACSLFILNQLLKCDKTEEGKRHIYSHHTCATDTNNIKVVWNAVQDIFIQKEFQEMF